MNMKVVFLLSCLQVLSTAVRSQTHFDTTNASLFKREIPKLKNGQLPTYYRNKHDIENMMGLPSVETGFDSLQLRIWYGYARTDSAQLIVLSKSRDKWSAQLYNFTYIRNANNKIKAITKKVTTGVPRQGWRQFSEKLFSFNITMLPDQSEINNYPDFADGDALIVEVATRNSYRIFSYKEPKLAQHQFKEADNVEQALALIEGQFDFKRLRIF